MTNARRQTILLLNFVFVIPVQAARLHYQDSIQRPLLSHDNGGKSSNGITFDYNARTNINGPRPFYMISHRVLVKQGVHDALKHGANAVEIDMTADVKTKEGWWADHDNTIGSRGDSARDMLEAIANARKQGKSINFVWLDLKNPDRCNTIDPKLRYCSILGLRDLAREILEPVGVRVLYGFYTATMTGRAFQIISGNLTTNEALNIDGKTADILKAFANLPLPIQQSQCVFSNGLFTLSIMFGNCYEKERYTCTECRQGVASQSFGKVFSWTASSGQADLVNELLGIAKIDGLIYGRLANMYDDGEDCRSTANDIKSWIQGHPEAIFLATNDQPPW